MWGVATPRYPYAGRWSARSVSMLMRTTGVPAGTEAEERPPWSRQPAGARAAATRSTSGRRRMGQDQAAGPGDPDRRPSRRELTSKRTLPRMRSEPEAQRDAELAR